MKASKIFETLSVKGIKPKSFTEGNQLEDGAVMLTDSVHISVPRRGALNLVTTSENGCMEFEKVTIDEIITRFRA